MPLVWPMLILDVLKFYEIFIHGYRHGHVIFYAPLHNNHMDTKISPQN